MAENDNYFNNNDRCKISGNDDELVAIRFVGRGGQGIVSAGELIAYAVHSENRYAQAIPHFGAERRGGPSLCSLRISKSPILLKCNVIDADVICVFDPTIWHFKNVFFGLKKPGILIFNTSRSGNEIQKMLASGEYGYSVDLNLCDIYAFDATSLALNYLSRPIVNTAMLGAFSKATGLVQIETLQKAIANNMKKEIKQNCQVAQKSYDILKVHRIRPGSG